MMMKRTLLDHSILVHIFDIFFLFLPYFYVEIIINYVIIQLNTKYSMNTQFYAWTIISKNTKETYFRIMYRRCQSIENVFCYMTGTNCINGNMLYQ